MKPSLHISALLCCLFLAACGTTTPLQTTNLSSVRKFSKVTVQDFTSSVADPEAGVATAKTYFPDRIAEEIRKTGAFSSVSRNRKPDANTLVIDGTITKFQEGNSILRLFVGMGAGTALFEANVAFRDGGAGQIGTIKVDKNSWALGGGVAAAQNPTMFMNGAAEKIAEEANKLER
jgi:hypothetical protein